MATGMFVNPLPLLKASKLLQFDFPADYKARECLPNVNVEAPEIEELYGKLGTPLKQQGHPCIMETEPEAEDPSGPPYQDQIIDIDRSVTINHTGRLSGSFIKYLASANFKSIVRIYANPLTFNGPVLTLASIDKPLTPGANAANTWFWEDPKTRKQLLFTAHVNFSPTSKGLKAGHTYKLICRWEFWDVAIKPSERMPISGFNEAISFDVSQKTQDL